jgi:hypothetical protein
MEDLVRLQGQARRGLPIVSAVYVGCVFVQVFLAGLGVFSREGFGAHQGFGYLFGWLTVVMLVLAIAGRTGRRLIGLSALTLVMFALQSVFVLVRDDLPIVAALHPVNGVATAFVALAIIRSARSGASAPNSAPGTNDSPAPSRAPGAEVAA